MPPYSPTTELAAFFRNTGPNLTASSTKLLGAMDSKRSRGSFFSRKKKSSAPKSPAPALDSHYTAKTLSSGQTYYMISTPELRLPPADEPPSAPSVSLHRPRSPTRRPVSLISSHTTHTHFRTPSPVTTPELTPHKPADPLPAQPGPVTYLFPVPPAATQLSQTQSPSLSSRKLSFEDCDEQIQEVMKELEDTWEIEVDVSDDQESEPEAESKDILSQMLPQPTAPLTLRSHHSLPSPLLASPSSDPQIAFLKATSRLHQTRMDEMVGYYLGYAKKWDTERAHYQRKIRDLEKKLGEMKKDLESKEAALTGLKWLLANEPSTNSTIPPVPNSDPSMGSPFNTDDLPRSGKLRKAISMPKLHSDLQAPSPVIPSRTPDMLPVPEATPKSQRCTSMMMQDVFENLKRLENSQISKVQQTRSLRRQRSFKRPDTPIFDFSPSINGVPKSFTLPSRKGRLYVAMLDKLARNDKSSAPDTSTSLNDVHSPGLEAPRHTEEKVLESMFLQPESIPEKTGKERGELFTAKKDDVMGRPATSVTMAVAREKPLPPLSFDA